MNISEIVSEFGGATTKADIIICMSGLILFAGWLFKTSFGRNALTNSVPRRNNMPPYTPFIPLFIWFVAVSGAIWVAAKLLPDLPDWQTALLNNLIFCIGGLTAAAIAVFLIKTHFVRGLKGFGLNPKTILKDFWAAVLNLFSVWPLLLLAIVMTTILGKFILGPQFQMQQHEELQLLAKYSHLSLKISVAVLAVIIAPFVEEILFRGLLQTVIRSHILKPWPAIFITSGLFAMVHAHAGHWPTLFVLAVCLGYSYEKSGSLFRPVFIHMIFNATAIIATLYQ